MEESEKRRERLKAMRMEASQAGVDNEVGNSAESFHLSNPLLETSAIPPLQNISSAPPRFDYYTDPMSAFSADKRRSSVSNQNSRDCFTPPRPWNPETTPPAHQHQTNYSPDQRMYQARGPYHSPGPRNIQMNPSQAHPVQPENYSHDQRMYQARGPYHSPGPRNSQMSPSPAHPVQTNYSPDQRMYQAQGYSTGPMNPVMAPSPGHTVQTVYSPDQRMYRAQGPYHGSGPYGSAIGMVSPLAPHQGTPGVWNESGGVPGYHLSPNSSGVGNFSSPRFGVSPSSNPGQGRGHWFGNSPSSASGFGGSPTSNFGRGRGHSSGRGRHRQFSSHNSVSAELRPDLYYDKSMVEDPWKLLTPVIWRETTSATSLKILNTLKSPLTNSVGIKKARISGASNESSSQPSLAEYLAAAFNEAANDGASNDTPSS